jgi:hypothetical protein
MDWRMLVMAAMAMAVSGCTRMAWEHYDECTAVGGLFQAMAACGKAKRMEYCTTSPRGCSDTDNSFVQFTDALSRQVANREMSDAEAMRRYVEFKTAQQNAQHQLQATAIASIPPVAANTVPSRPPMCRAVSTGPGTSLICN